MNANNNNNNKQNKNNNKNKKRKFNNRRRGYVNRGRGRAFRGRRNQNIRYQPISQRRPVAFRNTKNFQKKMRVTKTDANSMSVVGMDLVYSIPDMSIHEGSEVLSIIPCNPAYWTGTRIAALATGYQQFRPLKFVIHYVPIVGTTQQGNIFGGTIWGNISIPEENLQQTLVTSSGGMSTQVYQPKSAVVKCGDNLKYNLYNISGDLDDTSNPFYYVSIAVGNFSNNTRVTPGFLWVSYEFVFKNPIGNNTIFRNTGPIEFQNINYKSNTTAILLQPLEYNVQNQTRVLNRFTELQIDTTQDGYLVATYDDDFVPIEDEQELWVFQNYSNDEANAIDRKIFEIQFEGPQADVENGKWNIIAARPYALLRKVNGKNDTLQIVYAMVDMTTQYPTNYWDKCWELKSNEASQFDDIPLLHLSFLQPTINDPIIAVTLTYKVETNTYKMNIHEGLIP